MLVERSSSRIGWRCASNLGVATPDDDTDHGMQLNVKLKGQTAKQYISQKAGKVTVKGSNANVSHTINEDERIEFTNHINLVSVNECR